MIAVASPPPIRVAFVRAPHAVLHLAVANDDRRGALYCAGDVAPEGVDGRITLYAADVAMPLAGTVTDDARDVVLVGSNGTVVAVTSYAMPSNTTGGPMHDYTQVFARYVVELRTGRAAREGIVPGARVEVPPVAGVAAPVMTPPCHRNIR